MEHGRDMQEIVIDGRAHGEADLHPIRNDIQVGEGNALAAPRGAARIEHQRGIVLRGGMGR